MSSLPSEQLAAPLSQVRAHFCWGFPCTALPNGFFSLITVICPASCYSQPKMKNVSCRLQILFHYSFTKGISGTFIPFPLSASLSINLCLAASVNHFHPFPLRAKCLGFCTRLSWEPLAKSCSVVSTPWSAGKASLQRDYRAAHTYVYIYMDEKALHLNCEGSRGETGESFNHPSLSLLYPKTPNCTAGASPKCLGHGTSSRWWMPMWHGESGARLGQGRSGWRDPAEAKGLLNFTSTGAEICSSSAGQQRLMESFL